MGPARAQASPPGDDWSIETQRDDATLVSQRFAKLRQSPFDTKQWRALQKAIGKRGLSAKIRAAAGRAPRDTGLQILLARVELDENQPRKAAQRLEPIAAASSRWSGRAFDLRIDALSSAALHKDAVDALEARAATKSGSASKHLVRAFEIAQRGNLNADALRLAKKLAELSPKDTGAQIRLARAASQAGDGALADSAFAAAAATTKGARRDDLIAERARARAANKDLAGADELLWGLLEDANHGRSSERSRWWDMLIEVHRQDASGEVLAERVEQWLRRDGHADDAEAWKALAAAQSAAGLNPIPAWEKAIELDARDTDARAALITSLEAEGESKKAVAQFRALKGKTTEEVQLGLDMARRLITNGERETGMQLVAEIEAKAGRNAHTLLLLLDFYNGEAEHQKALAVAKRLVAAKGRDAEARIALGEQLFEMGRRDEALAQWAMLPKLVRPSHEGHFRHAEILSGHARLDRKLAQKASEEIDKAVKARPDNPNYLRLRASLLSERGRKNPEAIDAWQEVRRAAKGPEHTLLREEARTRLIEMVQPSYETCRSTCAARRDMLIRSAREELAGDDPELALEAGLFLAGISAAKQDYAAAASVQRDLLDLYPESPERHLALARAQVRAGQLDQAISTLEAGIELNSASDIEFLTMLSEVAFRSGDTNAARKAAERAASLGPDGARALLRLGESFHRRGDLASAEKAFRATLEAAPRNAEARTALADLQLNRGDLKGAAETYRALLEAGGNPELMREAGRRALDLAEASASLDALVALAVRRTKREPEAEEPREFLLDTLDRVGRSQVEAWLRDTDPAKVGAPTSPPRLESREAALRRALISGLNRGSIRIRLRAAQQLGELALPDTAESLARVGANLSPPRDATSAIRNAFGRVRATAILAAGQLRDPAAVPPLIDVLRTGSYVTQEAAAWSLANIGSPDALQALRLVVARGSSDSTRALACLGLAAHAPASQRREDALKIRNAIGDIGSTGSTRSACTLAAASLTSGSRTSGAMGAGIDGLAGLLDALAHGEAEVAAIAAWRLGQIKGQDAEIYPALFAAYFGPPGRKRDAAGAALSRRLRGEATPPMSLPEPPRDRAQWPASITRWVNAQVSSPIRSVPPKAVTQVEAHIHEALRRLAHGTRAEQAAAARVDACHSRADGPTAPCLGPLSDAVIRPRAR